MKWFLVIIVITSGHGWHKERAEMPSFERCIAALEAVRFELPNGDENEAAATAYCTTE